MLFLELRPKTSKTASILNKIKTKKVKKELYLIRQDNTKHKINFFFKYRTREIKATETNKLLILTKMGA